MATQDTENSIHLAPVGAAMQIIIFCCRNERSHDSPLGVAQISRITCQDHSP
jgi:hypothetical protein